MTSRGDAEARRRRGLGRGEFWAQKNKKRQRGERATGSERPVVERPSWSFGGGEGGTSWKLVLQVAISLPGRTLRANRFLFPCGSLGELAPPTRLAAESALEQIKKKCSRSSGGPGSVRAGFSILAPGRDGARPSRNGYSISQPALATSSSVEAGRTGKCKQSRNSDFGFSRLSTMAA